MNNFIVLALAVLALVGCKGQDERVKEVAFAEINALLVAPETSEFTNVKVYKESDKSFVVCGLHSSKNTLGVRGLNEWFMVLMDVHGETFKFVEVALDRRGKGSIQLTDLGDGKITRSDIFEAWAETFCSKTEKEPQAKS